MRRPPRASPIKGGEEQNPARGGRLPSKKIFILDIGEKQADKASTVSPK
jgi:hypothetical protein